MMGGMGPAMMDAMPPDAMGDMAGAMMEICLHLRWVVWMLT